jgi:S1-C subfamily serine protease
MNKKLFMGAALLAVILTAGFGSTKPADTPSPLTDEMQQMIMPEGGFRVGLVLSDSEEGSGVLVERVVPNSPADKAGIKKGDRIQKIDGVEVSTPRDIRTFFRDLEDSKVVSFELIRDGKPMNINVTPEKRTRPWLRGIGIRRQLGVQLQELDSDLAAYFNVDPNAGVLVARVEEDSAAAKAGMRSGDVITHIDGRKIQSAEDIRDAISELKEDQSVEITVLRHGDEKKFTVQPLTASFPEMHHMLRDLPDMLDRPEFKRGMDELKKEMEDLKKEMEQLKKDLREKNKELN